MQLSKCHSQGRRRAFQCSASLILKENLTGAHGMNQINLNAEYLILDHSMPPEIAVYAVMTMRGASGSLLDMRFFYCVVTFVVKCASIAAPF